MRKVTLTLTAAALALGVTALVANAQTQHVGAAGLNGQAHNFTPFVQKTACDGRTGGHGCGPGWVWNGNRCVRC
jgi:Spy/CpxP family protein refolding chaperone